MKKFKVTLSCNGFIENCIVEASSELEARAKKETQWWNVLRVKEATQEDIQKYKFN